MSLFNGLPLTALFGLPLMLSLGLITYIDWNQFRIPNLLSIPLIPLGLAEGFVREPSEFLDRAIAASVAAAFFFAVRHVYKRLRGIEGIGLGDVKLITVAGAWCGLMDLAPIVLVACLAALSMFYIRRWSGDLSEIISWQSKIPFGSFLAPAILAAWLTNLIHWQS